VVDAFGDAISQFLEVEAVFESLELTPQLIALTAPTSMVLVLSYGVQVPSAGIVGEITVCLPIATLAPALEKLTARVSERSGLDDETVVMTGVVHGLGVEIEAQLRATQLTAAQVAALQPGDVIVLDHRITDPAIGLVAKQPVFTAHVGRRGRRFAVAVAEHPFGDDVMRGPRELVGSHGQP
jgi:flagellar motor switch protein FliM